jgi:predicted secreted protein
MSSNALSAYGTKLKLGNGGTPTETFATVAEVKSINGASMTAEVIDVTTHSTGSPWREKIPSLLNAGTLTFDINYVPTDPTHDETTGLLGLFMNRTVRNWHLVFPDEDLTMFVFRGFVSNFEPSEPIDDVLSASITIEISGAITVDTETP